MTTESHSPADRKRLIGNLEANASSSLAKNLQTTDIMLQALQSISELDNEFEDLGMIGKFFLHHKDVASKEIHFRVDLNQVWPISMVIAVPYLLVVGGGSFCE